MLHRPRLALVAVPGLVAVLVGLGSAPARAADYPLPTHGTGTVDKSIVVAGDCVTFSGSGFTPETALTVTDDERVVRSSLADGLGGFAEKVCFATNATLGRHVLRAAGTGANAAPRDVTATVTVVGLSVRRPDPSAVLGGGSGGGGPAFIQTVQLSNPTAVVGSGNGTISDGTGVTGGNGGGIPLTPNDVRTLVVLSAAVALGGGVLAVHGARGRRLRRLSRLSV